VIPDEFLKVLPVGAAGWAPPRAGEYAAHPSIRARARSATVDFRQIRDLATLAGPRFDVPAAYPWAFAWCPGPAGGSRPSCAPTPRSRPAARARAGRLVGLANMQLTHQLGLWHARPWRVFVGIGGWPRSLDPDLMCLLHTRGHSLRVRGQPEALGRAVLQHRDPGQIRCPWNILAGGALTVRDDDAHGRAESQPGARRFRVPPVRFGDGPHDREA